MNEKIDATIQTLKDAKQLTVLHQNLTVKASAVDLTLPGTCVFSCEYYNTKFYQVQLPFKPISRMINNE